MGKLNEMADGWAAQQGKNLQLQEFISEEEIGICDQQILVWDGCDFDVDYLDVCADTGSLYFANGSKPEKWQLLTPPTETA